ncbi:MAG: hypothetical protein H0W64_07345 [Gammaproteobacteria bacterium]|nr:hypothetical protein [Gammaproteobacteria bacterium]
MIRTMKAFIFATLALVSWNGCASQTGQLVCGKILPKHASYVLKGKKKGWAEIYLLQNTGKEPITVNRAIAHPSASAGWSSQIDPYHHAALAITSPQFILNCNHSNDGKPTSCKPLRVCILKNANQWKVTGEYWLVENKATSDFSQALMQRFKSTQ